MDKAMIAPSFTAEALAAAGPYGAALLRATRIARPDQPVTAEAFGRLWRGIAAALDDEFFGLGARPMRQGSFVLLCHATRDAPVLEVALHRALRFLRVVLDHPHGRMTVESGAAVITLSDPRGSGAFAQRTYWILLHGLACWLTGQRIPLLAVDFAGPAPEGQNDYRQFFGREVRFGAVEGRLAFDARHLRLPIARSPAQLRAFLRGAPANLLLRYRHDGGVTAAVRRHLAADWPEGAVLAARLGMAESTLRHRLKAEGTSLTALRDAARRNLAMQALAGGKSVADVAADLGFAEPSAFHRAFRKWTGESPGQWGRRHRTTGARAD